MTFAFEGIHKLPILVTDEGIVTSTRDGHSEKTWSPIEVTEERIVICANFEHLWKA